MIGAVFVIVADRGGTRHSWIALGTRRANALRSMRHRFAFRAATTHDVTSQARSNAVVVPAGLVIRTLVVCLALRCEKESRAINKSAIKKQYRVTIAGREENNLLEREREKRYILTSQTNS